MADIYDQHATQVQDYVAAFAPASGQVGAVFAIGDGIEGLDLFDAQATFAEMLPKLVRSYAIDALERQQGRASKPSAIAADAFIARLKRAEAETYSAVGLGTEVRLTAPGIVAGGLVEDERVVHLAAFTAPAADNRNDQDPSAGLGRARSRRERVMGR
jgi:hypothetical protein